MVLLVVTFSSETADDTATTLRVGFSAEDPFVANIGLLVVGFLRFKEFVGSETIFIVAPLDLNLRLGGVGELDVDALELRLLGFLNLLGLLNFLGHFLVNIGLSKSIDLAPVFGSGVTVGFQLFTSVVIEAGCPRSINLRLVELVSRFEGGELFSLSAINNVPCDDIEADSGLSNL